MSELKLQFRVHLGVVAVGWNAHGMLTRIHLGPSTVEGVPEVRDIPAGLDDFIHQLKKYFDSGTPISAIPWYLVSQEGWTPFQRQVYQALAQIPFGETRTYGWVAKRLGKPSATRAVGQALRNNPMPIVVPCHRVVSADSLGGFMGCTDPELPELHFKQGLIALEEGYRQPLFPFFKLTSA